MPNATPSLKGASVETQTVPSKNLSPPADSLTSETPAHWRSRDPSRTVALVVDHQNLIGTAYSNGLKGVDPKWLTEIVLRIGNCVGMSLVTDLTMTNPITGSSHLSDANAWAEEGFSIVHVPARFIHATEEVVNDEGEISKKRVTRRKDQTDGGVRNEILRWCLVPEVTHIAVFTHDVDFARDMFAVSKNYGKQTVLMNLGNGISPALANSAHEIVNLLGYVSAFSIGDMHKRLFWHPKQNLDALGEKLWSSMYVRGNDKPCAWALRQYKDAQRLLRYLILDYQCIPSGLLPDAKTLSWKLIQTVLNRLSQEEKMAAGWEELDGNRIMVPAQENACMESIRQIMDIWVKNEVLLGTLVDHPMYGRHRQFYVNLDHPAVEVLNGTDFP